MNMSKLLPSLVILSISLALIPASAVPGYVPRPGDHFSYSETIDVGSGTGDYTGYSDHTVTSGAETMKQVFLNGTVSSNYSYSWTFSDNSGTRKTGGSSGNFTWSSNSFLYEIGTDNQTGYVSPTVWFFMDNSSRTGDTFYLLNTQMTVQSRNHGFFLPSENRYVNTIFAQGSSSYFRNDAYGQFDASYTWSAYFDPSTGYIIGYGYVEHDTNSAAAFTWTENLYVTSTSYPLAAGAGPSFLSQYGVYVVALLVVALIVIIIVVAYSRRGRVRIPKHAYQQEYRPPQPFPAPPPTVDLTPKQPPVQQIVVKEVVKVKCAYCGALIDSTAQVCPFCGGTSRT
jgi:hypothetical protein